VLNGEKAFISGGGASDVYIVMARTGQNGTCRPLPLIIDPPSVECSSPPRNYRSQGHLVLRCG
jgi:hypothetical protein